MSYVPMAGSLPEKAIAYLREREGEEIEDSAFADAMGTRRSWLFQTLKTAIKHGVVTRSVRVIKGGTRTLWSITGEGAKRLPEDERTVVRASPPALGWVPPNVPLFPGPYAEPGELEPLRDAEMPCAPAAEETVDESGGDEPGPIEPRRRNWSPAERRKLDELTGQGDAPARRASFALWSDGGIEVLRGDEYIALDAIEARRLVRFLERMDGED